MDFTTVFLTLFLFHSALGQLKWVELKPSAGPSPSARRDSAIGYDSARNQIVIFGGRGSSIFDDTWVFDLNSKKWTKVNETKDKDGKVIPENRFSVVYGSKGNFFYVSTGEGKISGVQTFYNDVNRYNFTSQKWKKLAPQTALRPEKRYGSGGGVYPTGNGLYVTHGFSGVRYSNTFKFRFDTQPWEVKNNGTTSYDPNVFPYSRCLHGTVMTDADELVLYGGCISGNGVSGPCPADDGWKYNGDTNTWTKLTQCATPRTYSAMALLPSNDPKTKIAVLYGGKENSKSTSPKNEIVVLNTATNKWTRKKIEGDVPMKRFSHVMVTTPEGIVVFGGRGSSGANLNDVWLLKGNVSDVEKTASLPGCDDNSMSTTESTSTTDSTSTIESTSTRPSSNTTTTSGSDSLHCAGSLFIILLVISSSFMR